MARIALVGPGSVGCFFAGHLAAAGHDLVACARRPFTQYRIDSDTHPLDHPATVLTDPADVDGPMPWVLVVVKAHQNAGAAGWLERLCGPDTRVVVVQNGIEHDRIDEFTGSATIVPSVVYCGAELIEPGHVRHHTGARLVVPDGPDADALGEVFAPSPIELKPVDDFITQLWTKLSLNVMANGLTALTRRDMTVFAEDEIQIVAVRLLKEAWSVARADGATLDDSHAERIVTGAAQREAPGGTSMYYDTIAGRPTEHDAIHGAALRRARKHGIDVPTIELMHALLEHRREHPG